MVLISGVRQIKPVIRKIIKEHSILDFLSNRGHFAVLVTSNRHNFICPFPDHKEMKPSFVVYTNSEYENYYCFGCNSYGSIIQLVSKLDGLSYKQTIEKLSSSVVESIEDDLKQLLDEIRNTCDERENTLSEDLISMASQCLLYCQGVQFDPGEVDVVDQYYSIIDRAMIDCEFEKIQETIKMLPKILVNRKYIFHKKREKNL